MSGERTVQFGEGSSEHGASLDLCVCLRHVIVGAVLSTAELHNNQMEPFWRQISSSQRSDGERSSRTSIHHPM